MGLDLSHGEVHWSYSGFMRWREAVCRAAGFGRLREDYWEKSKQEWQSESPSPMHELLWHSDCDGEIPVEQCKPLADALEALVPKLEEWARGHATGMVDALRSAAEDGAALEFR